MFTTLYRYPGVVSRHCEGPSVPERERFLIHCANEGMARATLLNLASEMLIIARRVNIEGGRLIDAEEVEAAADCWIHYQRRHHRISGSRFSRERFIGTATAWLRFLGHRWQPSKSVHIPSDIRRRLTCYDPVSTLTPCGHGSVMFLSITTNIYAEIGLEEKAKALAKCDINTDQQVGKRWLEDPDLMEFLHSL